MALIDLPAVVGEPSSPVNTLRHGTATGSKESFVKRDGAPSTPPSSSIHMYASDDTSASSSNSSSNHQQSRHGSGNGNLGVW